MLLSDHQSMIDSFLVGMGVYYPESLIRSSIIPWSPAAEENFYRSTFLSWLADNWKCIPVKKGRKDLAVVNKMKIALESSPLIIFPEGTRTRNTKIGDGRAGSGLVILESWPDVVPICIDGMDKILPVGTNWPRIFKKVYILYGKPIDLSEFKNREKNKETAQAVINRVMEEIRVLQKEIQEMKANT